MSIDARISSVKPRGSDLVLLLAKYQASDGTMSLRGQKRMVVKNFTVRPVCGQKIWGDAGQCIVEAGYGGERIEYKREGYAVLREQRPQEGATTHAE